IDKGKLESDIGLHLACTCHEGVHQPVHFGYWISADHADFLRLRHGAGDHPGEISGILDVVVENCEVWNRLIRLEAGTHKKAGVRVIACNRTGCLLNAKGFTEDQPVTGLAKLPHDTLVVRVCDIFSENILDFAALLCRIGSLVDAAYPLLLNRYSIDGGDFKLIGGKKRP